MRSMANAPVSSPGWTHGNSVSSARCRGRSPVWRRTARVAGPTRGSRDGWPRRWCASARRSADSPGRCCVWPGRRWPTRSGGSKQRACGCPAPRAGRPGPTGCCGPATMPPARRSSSCPMRRPKPRWNGWCAWRFAAPRSNTAFGCVSRSWASATSRAAATRRCCGTWACAWSRWPLWPNTRSNCGGKNPEVSLEQVCRALHELSRAWLRRQRQTSEQACVLEIMGYHQVRNRAARQSKQKREPIVRTRKKRLPRRRKRLSRCTVRS